MSPRRVALVTTQLLGFDAAGGVGAATAFLAIGLARAGHDIDVLYIKEPTHELDGEWAHRYEEAGVNIKGVAPPPVAVEPVPFRRMRAVELALRADTPDVVIAHEYGAPAYMALRLRRLGLAFQETQFVAYCHGTGPWVKEVTGNVRISPQMVAYARLEQAGVELADIVVSPSAYLLGWMRSRGWRLPQARVIPLVTPATAMDQPPSRERAVNGDGRVERLAYFGRLEERKGIRPFVAALNALPPEVLDGIDLEFLGGQSKYWDPPRVAASISERTTRALRSVSFNTELGRDEALARLKRPGTLAVMPSLAENSPNVVYECLEAGIPFLASAGGGIGELISAADRERVLFEPTSDGISAALRRALVDGEALRPVRPAFDGAEVLSAWGDVIATEVPPPGPAAERPLVDVLVSEPRDPQALAPQTYERVNVIRSLADGSADWVIILDEGDVPVPELVETLVLAQGASGADVVSCGLLQGGRERYFLGEPGGAGILENGYGTVALVRRRLLADFTTGRPAAWPLFAQLSATGARIVSVPAPLVTSERPPGTIERDPSDALLVVEALERALPDQARLLARLAAGLAAEKPQPPPGPTRGGRLRRRLGALVGGKPGGKTRGTS